MTATDTTAAPVITDAIELTGEIRAAAADRSEQRARALIAEPGADNIGLILDTYHWYTAGETVEDLAGLAATDIVSVDINDARADRARDEQMDLDRRLPYATGVIDLDGFMGAVRAASACAQGSPRLRRVSGAGRWVGVRVISGASAAMSSGCRRTSTSRVLPPTASTASPTSCTSSAGSAS